VKWRIEGIRLGNVGNGVLVSPHTLESGGRRKGQASRRYNLAFQGAIIASLLSYIQRQLGISYWSMHGLSIVYMFISPGCHIRTTCASLRTGRIMQVDGLVVNMLGWPFCIDTYSTSTSTTSRVGTVVMCEIDYWH
jgi:hypothetical protein